MALGNALLLADVAHARHGVKRNAFRYKVYYLCFALKDKPLLGRVRGLSVNRPNVFSFYDKDRGDGVTPAEQWIQNLLHRQNITAADGDVTLLTMPRILGYAFNPVSFWFCRDRLGQLRAVVSEVNNTFGDRHFYIACHDDQRPIAPDEWLQAQKVFHVSPFFAIEGHYRFRFDCTDERVAVFINHHGDDGRLLLTTSMVGPRQPLTTRRLFHYFFRYPLVTFKVIGLIHYQAFKLIFKGVQYRTRPLPPTTEVTRT